MSKPLRAYAVVNSKGRIDLYTTLNGQVPVFWLRRSAIAELSRPNTKVKRVDICIVERKQP